ncbi:unnamed protein product [Cuscuta epithymum]|uniref:Uncharacterized protein n=1 Tax=Cuscuta epithymum TaxID=186058 RepID=A0AAV0C1E4_9ASTE|nr:unnamed protein product [Cuscuta epithymum]
MEKEASIGILVQTCQGWIIEEEEGIVIDLGGDDKGKEQTRNFEWLVEAEGSPTIRPPPEPPSGPPLQDFSFKVEDLGLEELRAGSGDLFWAKEDEEMLTRPPLEPPPWRNCASRIWKSISIFVFSLFVFLLRYSCCFGC